MINVLQKVTTFPIESMEFPEILDIKSQYVHNYYSEEINTQGNTGPLNDSQIKGLKDLNDKDKSKKILLDEYKKRYIVYNAIYNKIFSNCLNVLEKINENTIIIPAVNLSVCEL